MDSDNESALRLIKNLKAVHYDAEYIEQHHRLIKILQQEKTDVLILDVEAYGVKCYELIPLLKKINRYVPIVVTSADDSIETATKVRELGIFFYAVKPVNIKELDVVLKNALRRSLASRPSKNRDASPKKKG